MADWLTLGSLWVATAAATASAAAVFVSYIAMRAELDPHVVVYAKHDTSRPSLLVIVIENVGRGMAYDIRFSITEALPARAFGLAPGGNEPASPLDRGPLVTGVPVLAPADKRVITWGQYGGLHDALGERSIGVEATFWRFVSGSRRRGLLKSTSTLEIASFEGTDASAPPEVAQVRELERIRTSLEASQRHLSTLASVIAKPEVEEAILRARKPSLPASAETAGGAVRPAE